MKLFSIFIFIVLLIAQPGTGLNAKEKCVSQYDPQKDYFPDKTTLKYARGFTLEYFKNYKIIRVLSPWKGAKKQFTYLAVQCGTPVPQAYANMKKVIIPVQRTVSMSVTQLGLMDQLGVTNSLVGIAKGKIVHTASVKTRFLKGEIQEVGSYSNVNMEILAILQPDLVFTFSVGQSVYDNYRKMAKVGIPVVLMSEYMEGSPLGRSEWIKFLAAFFNREKRADEVFNQVAREYQRYKELTRQLKYRPTVLVNQPFKGTWHIPANNSYVAQLIRDAGGAYDWKTLEGQGSYPLEFEAVLANYWSADVWIHPGFHTSLDSILRSDERYAKFSAFQKGAVFNNNALVNDEGGNDYWETGVANPHLLLADLIKIFHPQLLPKHKWIWYRQLK